MTTVERGTTITKNDVNISTIEHLLAAVVGLQIDNILIQIDSEEVPILDGSSKEFIESLESKYETTVGEKAIKLSGGQAQRIGIARALYFNPEILIFDEATSSLDKLTEQYITDFINTMVGKKIIILSTHKEYQLQNCDKIYEVKHNKLLKKI